MFYLGNVNYATKLGESRMGWTIKLDTDQAEYTVNGKTFETEQIVLVDQKMETESSSEYKAPNDDVMINTYVAQSEHGEFKWEVMARRSGFDTYAEIDAVENIEIPSECELSEPPEFSIEDDE